MAAGSTTGKDLSIEQLAELREKTDAVSELLSEKEGPENQNRKIPPKKSPCWVQSAPN